MREEAELGEANPNTREGHLTRLVDHLRNQMNEALAFGHDNDAAEMQVTECSVGVSCGGCSGVDWS